MSHGSTELALYAMNDSSLYHRMLQPISKNLAKKAAKGKYSSTLALKAWMHFSNAAAKQYAKEFGGSWNQIFSVFDRKEAARYFRDQWEAEHRHSTVRKNPIKTKSAGRRLTPENCSKSLSGSILSKRRSQRDKHKRMTKRVGKCTYKSAQYALHSGGGGSMSSASAPARSGGRLLGDWWPRS